MKHSLKKRIILLDSHAIIHRAYHALPDFLNSNGEPTGALYGLCTMLMKIITDLHPDYMIACYDLPQKTFRHETFKGYKAGRAKADDALVTQLETSRTIFEAFNIPIYDAAGFEADDIIGTIAEKLKKDKTVEVIIASGDMDTIQLVSDKGNIQVFTLKRGLNDTILYDEPAVKKRFGFGPELIPDYKGLAGDASDNIPGIRGIGEKTATALLVEFGTIEQIYSALKKDSAFFKKAGFSDRIIKLLQEGEEEAFFSKTLATIRRDAPIDFYVPAKTLQESIDIPKVETMFQKYEFRSLGSRLRKIFNTSETITSREVTVSTEGVSEEEINTVRIALWLLNSELSSITLEDIFSYAHTHVFAEAKKKILADISTRGLSYVYEDIELAICPIVNQMSHYGIKIDTVYLSRLSEKYHTELTLIEKQIWKLSGHEFNINSPKQLGDVLFDELAIGVGTRLKKTAGGARSTRESELLKLRGVHPIIDLVLSHRELQKLLSTYIDVLPGLLGTDGRLHAKFNQAGTTTGRFSSQDPNLQNIPVRSVLGNNIRHAFIAAPGHTLISFDYSQIELRIAALMAQDEFMIQVFNEHKDIHAAVASKVFGVSEDKVDSEQRRRAKIINFGILYGMGVNALRENLGTDRADALAFYDNYFIQFPKIAGYLETVKQNAYKDGYTETLFGRRRYFPGLKSKMPFVRAMAERMAINAPLQGTAADCIKIAIRDADIALRNENLLDHAHLILQVHDELVYEVEDSVVSQVSVLVENAMKNVLPREFLKERTPVPLEVHVEKGKNWGELK